MRQVTRPMASACAASLGKVSTELSSGPCPCFSPETQTILATREQGLGGLWVLLPLNDIGETCQWLLRWVEGTLWSGATGLG